MAGSDTTKMNQDRSRKRSRQLFDSIMDVVNRNIDQLPAPKPKRLLEEAHLRTVYLAEKSQAQQAPPVRTNRFFSSPSKGPAKQPSLFSPATSKLYASPFAKSVDSPARQPIAAASSQQPAGFGASPRQPSRVTPVNARPHQPTFGSRLGPSRMQPQASPSSYPMHFLDSAPATAPVQSPAPVTGLARPFEDHAPSATPVDPFLPDGYYATTPANGTPYGVANLDQAAPADGQMADGVPMSGRMGGLFAEADATVQQSQQAAASLAQGHNVLMPTDDNRSRAGVSQQSQQAAASLSQAHNRLVPQSNGEDRSRASAFKRLAARKQGMTAAGSPAQGFSLSLTSTPRSSIRGRGVKRTASEIPSEVLDGPAASRQRMEAAIKAIPQAQREAEKAAAAVKAAAQGPAPPPSAFLGFGPASHTSAQSQSAKGKHSWPANYFEQPSQQPSTLAVATAGSETSNGHDSDGSGAVAGLLENGHSEEQSQDVGMQHEADAEQHDYGAAWREAAESPSPISAVETGAEPQVTSPPFSAPRPRQTPVPPPQASLFTSAPSPATVPAELFTSGSENRTANGSSPVSKPSMFSSTLQAEDSFEFASPWQQQDSLHGAEAAKGTLASNQDHATEQGDGHKAPNASSAPIASGWGAALLQSNKAAAGQAAEAAADPNKAEAKLSKPAASGWGAAFLQGNKAAAGQSADAAADPNKAEQERQQAGQGGSSAPKYSFGVTPAAAGQTVPVPVQTTDSQANASQQVKSQGASPAPASKFSFGMPAGGTLPIVTSQPAWPAFIVPSATDSNAALAQELPDNKGDMGDAGQAAAKTAADDAKQAEQASAAPAARPAASGWGTAPVLGDQPAATQAPQPAGKDDKQSAGQSAPLGSPFKISFGLPTATNLAASPPIAIPHAPGSTADAAQDGNGSLARDGSFMSISPPSFSAHQQAKPNPMFSANLSAAPPNASGFPSFTGFATSSQPPQPDSSQQASTSAVGSSIFGSAASTPLAQQPFPPATFSSSQGVAQQAQAGLSQTQPSVAFGQQAQAGFASGQQTQADFAQQAQAGVGQTQPGFAFGQQPQAISSAPLSQQPPAPFMFGQPPAAASPGSDQQPQGILGRIHWQAPASQQAGSTTQFAFGQPAAAGSSQIDGAASLQFGQAATGFQQPAQAQGMAVGANPAAAPSTFGSGAFGQITSAFPAAGAAASFNIGAADAMPKTSGRRKVVTKRRHR